jgi:hypothetical protein
MGCKMVCKWALNGLQIGGKLAAKWAVNWLQNGL